MVSSHIPVMPAYYARRVSPAALAATLLCAHMTDGLESTNSSEIVARESATTAVLDELFETADFATRRELAANKMSSPELLTHLAQDNDLVDVVAKNPASPALLLDSLAAHRLSPVRARVAENPSTRIATLLCLAGDDSRPVRLALLNNASTPPAALELLVRHELEHGDGNWETGSSVEVLWAAAEHPNTPVTLLLDMPASAAIWSPHVIDVLPHLDAAQTAAAAALVSTWVGTLRSLLDAAVVSHSRPAPPSSTSIALRRLDTLSRRV